MARGRVTKYPPVNTYAPGWEKEAISPKPNSRRPGHKVKVGAGESHRRLLEQEARLYEQFTEHEANGETIPADRLRSEWSKLAVAIGTAETRELKNAMRRGDLLHGVEVDQAFSALLHHLPEVLRAGFKEIMKPYMDSEREWGSKADKLLDDLFAAVTRDIRIVMDPKK